MHGMALKEWSAVVAALLAGRQRILLRKGGIHEKRFDVSAAEFLLFPTSVHSHAERVRAEYRDLLGPASADSTAEQVVIRAAAKVVAALPVERPNALEGIADLHIWTDESVRADRLDFRPKHRLTALVVQVFRLSQPVRLDRSPDYAGCASWVQLPIADPELGAPICTLEELDAVTARVRDTVG
ncbi:DUF1802 family protein [Mycolicibacter minnesotensis]|nr:DUF1802 family protein [Mycolicibacter minnesotensis]BBY32203.1 hypothetical protein MMIN_02640 [Mycolicibacter minnesotensis]